jgi:HlyD family secretion protein
VPPLDGPIPVSPRQRREDFRRRVLPVMVWSLAALACAGLLFQRTRRLEYVGIAQAPEHEVSAGADGVVQSLEVELLETVEAGAIVARLDDAALRAAIETARARIAQLEAETEAAHVVAAGEALNLGGELRRFQADEERRRLEVLAQRVELSADQVEAERLGIEARRQQELFAQGVVSASIHDNARLAWEAMQRRVEEGRALLEQTAQELATASHRRQLHEARLPPGERDSVMLAPLRESIAVENRVLDEIEVLRRGTVLRSAVAGQVTQVWARAGQAVVTGEPVLTIVEAAPREIVAYLSESDPAEVRSGTRALVSSRRRPDRTAESLVLRDSRAVVTLPQRLWRDPRAPEFGRPVVLASVPALELVPGELVAVRFLNR